MQMENQKPVSNNLANYYVLPLLTLNKNSYGVGNFVNAFISDKGEIVVEVLDSDKVPSGSLENHPNYLTDFTFEDENPVIVYSMPDGFSEIPTLFTQGRYSEFPVKAKNLIKEHSGLAHNVKRGSAEPFTADLLLVLERDPGLRARRAKELNATIDSQTELWSKPSVTNFYYFK